MAKRIYESQISKQVKSFATERITPPDSKPEPAPEAQNTTQAAEAEAEESGAASKTDVQSEAPASEQPGSTLSMNEGYAAETVEVKAPTAKKPQGRPRKNGEKVRVSLAIPEVLYAKIQEDADKWGGGNVTRTINKVLGERYGVTIY